MVVGLSVLVEWCGRGVGRLRDGALVKGGMKAGEWEREEREEVQVGEEGDEEEGEACSDVCLLPDVVVGDKGISCLGGVMAELAACDSGL